jgi:antirestriction protein ArdC
MKFTEVFDKIAADVVTSLEEGQATGEWRKPWAVLGQASGAQSVDRRQYRGINTLILGFSGRDNSAPWGTYKTWAKHGAQVRKGEKGTAVVFWKFTKYQDKKTGEDKASVLTRSYNVFHASQVDGFDLDAWEGPVAVEPKGALRVFPAADAVLDAWNDQECPISYGGDVAAYSPPLHLIKCPAREQFADVEGFYSTVLHEVVHSTGKEQKRDMTGGFGSESYGNEELVAEMGSAMLCGALGVHDVGHVQQDQHKAYIKGWIERIKADPKVLIYAAQRAQKAADMVLKVAGMIEVDEERKAA